MREQMPKGTGDSCFMKQEHQMIVEKPKYGRLPAPAHLQH